MDEIVRSKEEKLFGRASGFTIEQAEDILRAQLVAELTSHHEAKRARLLREVLPPAAAATDDGAGKNGGSAEAIAAVQADLAARLTDLAGRHAADLVPFAVTDPPLLPRKVLTLAEALEIAAENSRDYQRQKESVYLAALDVTLQRYLF